MLVIARIQLIFCAPQLPETKPHQFDGILLNAVEFGTNTIDNKIDDNSSKLIEIIVVGCWLLVIILKIRASSKLRRQ